MAYKDQSDQNAAARKSYAKNREANAARIRAHSERYRARNRAIVDEAKSAPCVDCGGEFPPIVMDLHHRDPSTKVAAVSNMVHAAVGVAKLEAEIAKCDVLCSNCHRLRHATLGSES